MTFRRIAAAALAALFAMLAVAGPATATPGKAAPMLQFVQQTETGTPVDQPELLNEAAAVSIGNGVTYNSGIIDVRAFNSFIMYADANQGTALATDTWEVDIRFYADAAGTNIVFRDRYTLFPSNTLNGGTIRLTDQMHGGWVRILIYEPLSVGRTFTLNSKFYGSFRMMSNAYFRASSNGELLSIVGAVMGAGTSTAGQPALMGYGSAMVTFGGDTGVARMDIYVGGTTAAFLRYRFDAPAAGARQTAQIILPKQQAWVVLTNTGAAGNTIRAQMYNLIQPY